MKKIFTLLVLFVALGVSTANAQYNTRNQNQTKTFEPGVYQDEQGEYRWQTIENRVWIPERRTSGIFGIGARTIPGHYEVTTTDRVKVYTRSDRNSQTGDRQQGWAGKHPHGMPPGQRKKIQSNNDQRWDGDNNGSDKTKKGKKHKNHDNDDDRD